VARASRSRLDVALVERGLVPTRARAQALIMARRVLLNGQFAEKPGAAVKEDDRLEVQELEHPWVGRGGMKLAGALDHFEIDPAGLDCADIGASTGGFTDVLLQRGARRVWAIDVGYGQLDQKLREDLRVVNREKVNARYLEITDFEAPLDLVSIDVSFISLRLILPAAARVLKPGGLLVALIKPQFEAGKGEIGKGGIVRDPAVRSRVIAEIEEAAAREGFRVVGVIDSPIKGSEGNLEALLHAILEEAPHHIPMRPEDQSAEEE
jgi:23S rRNA (cytidine1920-2'-O)/16S rRNA (cytidine1409-2'-O)-methyltransferase